MVRVGDVATFLCPSDGFAQGAKVCEECAEVMEELAAYWAYMYDDQDAFRLDSRRRLVEECCDVIQATCNLLAGLGVEDVTEEMGRVRAKNEARGRAYGKDA